MQTNEDIKQIFHVTPERIAFDIERRGGYCPDVNLNAKFGIIVAGYGKVRPDCVDNITDYPFYRLTYTIEGQATLIERHFTYTLTPGMIFCFQPGESSFTRCDKGVPWACFFVNFFGPAAAKLVSNSALASQRTLHTTRPNEVQDLMSAILDESLLRNKDSQAICAYYLRILFMKLAPLEAKTELDISIPLATYHKCKNFIDENYYNVTAIDQVAKECTLSRQHMSRLFKTFANTTPLQYLTRLKLNRAAVMLLEGQLSIKEIAFKLNFSDQFYFSKCFKKHHGTSPSIYKRLYS